MAIDSKRIAKNTIFLYARLILVLGVTLYTSRVVLDKLGVDDYGLYNVVFSVIGLLSFLNGTLSSGTSRFITFALGKGDNEGLKTTFSTTLCTHVLLAGIILLLGETLGIWYVYNVMVCPPERFQAAFIVYQISILVTMLSIILVPFTSEIMAHEKMDFYAYIGIYEAVAKLAIVYLLSRSAMDKMVLYAILIDMIKMEKTKYDTGIGILSAPDIIKKLVKSRPSSSPIPSDNTTLPSRSVMPERTRCCSSTGSETVHGTPYIHRCGHRFQGGFQTLLQKMANRRNSVIAGFIAYDSLEFIENGINNNN